MFVKRSLLIVILLLSSTVDAWSGGLSKRLQSQITERIVPAYFRGNSAESLKLLSPLAAKLDEEELTEVDALLSDQGVPDLGALLLDARMKLMMQEGQTLRPHPREASLALPVLRSEIEQVLQDVEELALLEARR